MYQKHCPGCFQNKQGLALCPHCGYDESVVRGDAFLPHGHHLEGQYRVGRVLGKPGGFGITYLAWDVHLQQRVAIKECLPRELAGRAADGLGVVPLSAAAAPVFEQVLAQFLQEARLLARIDHPNVMRVRSFFRAGGTAYFVMDFYDGTSLGEYLESLPGPVGAEAAVPIIEPVLEGLQAVHDAGVLHRDVKPRNIYLSRDGRPILLDFGAALPAGAGDAPGEGPGLILSDGYAPLEQYQKKGAQGPWTDVYGAAATLYRMVLGHAPPQALDRIGDAVPLSQMPFEPRLQSALAQALALAPEARTRSAREFKAQLQSAMAAQAAAAAVSAPAAAAAIAVAAASVAAQAVPAGASEDDPEAEHPLARTLPAPRSQQPAPEGLTHTHTQTVAYGPPQVLPRRPLIGWPQAILIAAAIVVAALILAFAR